MTAGTSPTSTDVDKKQFKYRLYFRLMDLALVFCAIATISIVLDDAFGIDIMPGDKWWGAILGIPTAIGVTYLPTFLIVAKFMRDEYAELLWRRTGIVVIYILAIGPLIYMISAWIAYWITRWEEAFFPFNLRIPDTNLHTAMAFSSIVMMVVFVMVFQFLRWKDSR